MSNYTPPDSHNVILNFDEISTGSTDLNFGEQVVLNIVDAEIDLSFISEIVGTYKDAVPTDQNRIDAVVDLSFFTDIFGTYDLNFNQGVYSFLTTMFQKAVGTEIGLTARYAKPIFRAQNSAFYFEQAQGLSCYKGIGFDCTQVLQRDIRAVFEESTGLNTAKSVSWNHAEKCVIARNMLFDESKKLRVQRNNHWDELIRKRKQFTFSHEVAHVFEKRFSFSWDKGLELVTKSDIPWQQARSIYYRKHPILPWPKPKPKEYVGSGDLNFICLWHDVDAHNVILNFGDEDCIPSLAPRDWWYIVNKIEVSRLDNGEQITVIDGSYNTSRSQWCWSYSLTVPASEISKLEPINAQPVILKIQVNDNVHHMLLENRSRSRRFAQDTWKLTGRSQTALLDAPYSPTRSFLQENERTSVQLAQAELDRVNSDTQLNWQLIDELGWIVPINSLSYANQTPIAVIKQIAEAGGGFVYSEKGSNTLSIRPKYKKTFWDAMQFEDYDRLLPEGLVTNQSTDYEPYPDYNGVTLTNDRTGFTGIVKRTGTAGDVLQETVSNPLFTAVSMGSYGKALLAKAGLIETHSLEIPVQKDVGECEPGEIIAFNAEWWGIVDSVSVSFTHAVVNQNITVERILNE
ncbi:hypothetical protein RFI02_11350 [Acinetobacter sichuanensis]|uniref:hypothetical protein n=1 Tax=Acinetobacter sichuanensis TaxID=2136183 RepID=UPI002810612F|nr:hypothetical protein [Acinetobacter sichuanensis]MDQ9021704.1 hypothetical protein [Acinetobacter sichuanensis]